VHGVLSIYRDYILSRTILMAHWHELNCFVAKDMMCVYDNGLGVCVCACACVGL